MRGGACGSKTFDYNFVLDNVNRAYQGLILRCAQLWDFEQDLLIFYFVAFKR